MDYLGVPKYSHKYLCKRKAGGHLTQTYTQKRRRHCDHESRDWSDETTSQGMPTATRSWKRQGTDCPLEPPERTWPCHTLISAHWHWLQTLDSRLWEHHLFLFQATKFMVICYSSKSKWIQWLRYAFTHLTFTQKIKYSIFFFTKWFITDLKISSSPIAFKISNL